MPKHVWIFLLPALFLLGGAGCSNKAAAPAMSTARPAPSSSPTTPTDAPTEGAPWQQTLLAEHNALRQQVGIPALTWSGDVAAYAQAWADELARRGCALEHRPRQGAFAQRYGENIAQGTALTASQVVALWSDEKPIFEAASDEAARNTCGGRCGHYTQMVWKDTQTLGCGMADQCGLWVCNYDPPGNYLGQKPY